MLNCVPRKIRKFKKIESTDRQINFDISRVLLRGITKENGKYYNKRNMQPLGEANSSEFFEKVFKITYPLYRDFYLPTKESEKNWQEIFEACILDRLEELNCFENSRKYAKRIY